MKFCIIVSIILALTIIYVRYYNDDSTHNNIKELIERSDAYLEDKIE